MADKKIRLLVQAEVKKAVQALNKVEKEQKDIKKNNDKLKQSFKAIGGTIAAAFSVQVVTQFLKESVKLGSQMISLERAFTNLGKGVGFNEKSLQKFRKATDGTVSDVELMTQANNAMLLGIVQSDDQFADLIDNAQRLAQAVGQDAVFGIESLTTGIGRQSKLMLDNLGIIVDTQKAYDVYAESIGKSTSELDDNERKQAFIQATMESVNEKVAQLGKEQLTAADATNQLTTAFSNLQGTIGKELQDEIKSTNKLLAGSVTIMDFLIQRGGLFAFITGQSLDSIARANNEAKKAAEILPELDVRFPETDPIGQAELMAEGFGLIQGNYDDHNKAMAAIDENALNFRMNTLEQDFFMQDARTKNEEANINKMRKIDKDAHKERMQNNLQSAILQGQSAKQAGIAVIKSEISKSTAALITKIMQTLPFPVNLAVAAGAGAMVGGVTDKLLNFQTGGSFVTKGRTTLPIGNGVVVGDNASGMERVDVTPLPAPPGGNNGNITINISAPLVDETVVDHIIPAIRRAEQLNL